MKIITLETLPKYSVNLGVFIGSFDPIHRGHLELAQKSLKYVDQVLFYPVGSHIQKTLSPIESRIKSLQQVANDSFAVLKLSLGEVTNPGPGWDKVFEILKATAPNSMFWLIRGIDKLHSNSYSKPDSLRFKIPHILGVDTCVKTTSNKANLIQKLGWFEEVKLVGLQKYGGLSSSRIKQNYETI